MLGVLDRSLQAARVTAHRDIFEAVASLQRFVRVQFAVFGLVLTNVVFSTEVIEIILRQLWNNDIPHHPDEIIELPQLLKQFITRCKELGNSRSKLAAFAGEVNDDTPDSTTVLCKIIWVRNGFKSVLQRAYRY